MQQGNTEAAERRTTEIRCEMMQIIAESDRKNEQLLQAVREKATAVGAVKDKLVQAEREKGAAVAAVRDELYKKLLDEKEKRVEEQREWLNMMTDLNKTMITNHTQQFEAMSWEMRSLTEALNRTLGRQSSGADGGKLCPPIGLKKPHVIIMDNIASHNTTRKCVKRDQALIKEMFKSISVDVAPIKRGHDLGIALEDCEEEDYSVYDGIIVVVFSSGSAMTLDDGGHPLSVHCICQSFARIPSLYHKPKIIFVHATDKPLETSPTTEQEHETVDNTLLCYWEQAEQVYIDDFNENHGSYFVRCLGRAFQMKRRDYTEDILNAMEKQTSDLQQKALFEMRNSLPSPVYLYS